MLRLKLKSESVLFILRLLAATTAAVWCVAVQAQQGRFDNGGFEPRYQNSSANGYGQGISRAPQSENWLADGEGANWRSKSDVKREAKRRYDARVLKITLNEERGVYRVRLLMPNGKVRVVSVNARR